MAAPRARTQARLPLSIEPKALFVTGKGGVGKSTVTAALALAYREAGVRTLLVELSGQTTAASLLAGTKKRIGYDPVAMGSRLWGMSINGDDALREYARLRLKIGPVADRLVSNPIFHQFAQVAPGFRELLVLGKLWELSEQVDGRRQPRYEAIVIDAPSTGHGLGLLGMAGVVARAFPVGPVAAEATRIDQFVRDPSRAGVVLVTLPEEMPVNEALQMHSDLHERQVDVSAVVVNALLRQRFTEAQVQQIDSVRPANDVSVTAALESALYEHERWTEQSAELARLEAGLTAERTETDSGPAHVLPFLYEPQIGRPQIEELARQLRSS